jgi:amino acid transporter
VSQAGGVADQASRLRAGSIGTAGIVFFVVAAAAPLAATLGAGPVVFIFAGPGAPAMYLIAALALLLFSFGFALMSRFVTNAGGFVAFISWGLGRRAGYAAAGVALLAYVAMFVGISAQFATFASDLANRFFGVEVPWQVAHVVGVLIIGILGYRDIRVSAILLGVLLILEVLILLVFDVAVLAQGGADGINVDSFMPVNIFTPTMGLALLFAFACFVGFEATILYGEEARDPKKSVPRATYIAVAAIGILYTLTMWSLSIAYGTDAVQKAAEDDPVGFVLNATAVFLGTEATVIMEVLVLTSLLAVLLSFQNALSRYVYSLGRAGFLSRRLGVSHPKHKSPSRASLAVTVVILAVLAVFMLSGADPFSVIYMWMIGVGTLGVLLLQAAGAAAVVFYLRRYARNEALWRRFIAPTIGGIMLAIAVVLAVTNFGALIDSTGVITVLLPVLYLIAIAVGLFVGAVRTVDDLRHEHLPDTPEDAVETPSY